MALVLAATAVLAAPATADPAARAAFLQEGDPAEPTRAWVDWCRRMPGECAARPEDARVIPRTAALDRLLDRVNLAVNGSVRSVTDQEHWGVADRWDFPEDGRGDCEDLQVEKRRRLIAAGLPRAAMRIAMVINPEGEGHAVLVVRTDAGDLVLDNRVNRVKPWYRTGYTWVKWEALGGRRWVSLGGVVGRPETAARR